MSCLGSAVHATAEPIRPGRSTILAMSFDKNDGIPIVNVHKPTTRVNIWMVVAVVAFLLFGVFAVLLIK